MSTLQATHTMNAKSHRGLVDLIFSAFSAVQKEIRIRRSLAEVSSMDEYPERRGTRGPSRPLTNGYQGKASGSALLPCFRP
jgi:hypothetical protein